MQTQTSKNIQINNINKEISSESKKQDELILVVKKDYLFEQNYWQGIAKLDFANYLQIIKEKKEFLPRSLMENDFSYKQIIPYLIFTYDEKLFLMQRRSNSSETRLSNKYSLGIGGHIRQEDMTTDSIIDWAKREFAEEINYDGKLEIEPIGMLNDDSNEVGKVHIGFVFLLHGNSDKIKIKSELKSGQLITLEECKLYYDSMESWSKLVLDLLDK